MPGTLQVPPTAQYVKSLIMNNSKIFVHSIWNNTSFFAVFLPYSLQFSCYTNSPCASRSWSMRYPSVGLGRV
uniref:Uncharacterized protein n=1 Tax=Anguilla anguilla TaxID=7936 RepID=A0A0E9QHE3_ANGAN